MDVRVSGRGLTKNVTIFWSSPQNRPHYRKRPGVSMALTACFNTLKMK